MIFEAFDTKTYHTLHRDVHYVKPYIEKEGALKTESAYNAKYMYK